MYLFDVGVI